MPVTFRNYSGEKLYTQEYLQVREFLVRINQDTLASPNFPWGRWEWMIGHGWLDDTQLHRICLWEDEGRIVAMATYEGQTGEAYFCLDPEYTHLKAEMLHRAKENLVKDGKFRALINDNDREFQRIAAAQGYRPTQNRELLAEIDIGEDLHYTLPEGYKIVSMADDWDWHQYNRCLWRGFDHPGDEPQTDEQIAMRRRMLSGPGVNPELVLCVMAPGGNYVSHCGTWYMPGDTHALVEPVATDPDYRKMGLGKAAVLEAVTRCGKLGARHALVGSSQQFYYNIGFAPIHTETWWEARK